MSFGEISTEPYSSLRRPALIRTWLVGKASLFCPVRLCSQLGRLHPCEERRKRGRVSALSGAVSLRAGTRPSPARGHEGALRQCLATSGLCPEPCKHLIGGRRDKGTGPKGHGCRGGRFRLFLQEMLLIRAPEEGGRRLPRPWTHDRSSAAAASRDDVIVLALCRCPNASRGTCSLRVPRSACPGKCLDSLCRKSRRGR